MPNTVQTPTNPVNEAHKQYNQSRTQFPMTYLHYTTENYGIINPFFAMEGVPGDTIPLDSKHEIRAHTFKAPLMSNITKNKDYYNIPMRAILPRTWELIYANPTQGDDIPEDANCCLNIRPIFRCIQTNFNNATTFRRAAATEQTVENVLRFIVFCEYFVSDGSLLSKVGYHLAPLFTYKPATYSEEAGSYYVDESSAYTFDQWIDMKLPAFLEKVQPVIQIGDDATNYAIAFDEITAQADVYVPLTRFMEMIRDYVDFKVQSITYPDGSAYTFEDLFDPAMSYTVLLPGAQNTAGNGCPLNIGRAIAYQLCCFHFYTNDKVDSIYSAQLYRGMIQAQLGAVASSNDSPANASQINSIRKYFTYNGELLEYDTLSEAVLNGIMNSLNLESYDVLGADQGARVNYFLNWVCALRNILGYNRSLRYGDYFTGARPSPLAVGDVNTTVVSNEVNAIDLTRSLLMQRFLNAVNRVGRKFAPYVQLLSGRTPMADPTSPQFLAHDVSSVGSFEVENTAENQGNIVTIARSSDSRYAFSYDVNEPCIVLGVSWYEVARIYSKTIDRHAFHRTRFDMFNKFFQYQGDQAIFRKELNARYLGINVEANFAYTLRYMEYKQRPSIATGGFVRYLPGYAFITDNDESGQNIMSEADMRISPEFIRARQSEFDRFYSSLTGVSLAGYFHFIVKYTNVCEPQRQMEYAPSVL